jgi:hypothetical protein
MSELLQIAAGGTDLFKAVADHGLSVVMAVVCLGVFLTMYRKNSKREEERDKRESKRECAREQREAEKDAMLAASYAKISEDIGKILTLMSAMSEGLNDKSLTQAQLFIEASLIVSRDAMYFEALEIKEKNHLEGNERAIKDKIYKIANNIYHDRNQKFEKFKFKGVGLFSFTRPEWVTEVAELVYDELYSDGFTPFRLRKTLEIIYTNYKIEMFTLMIKL